MDAHKTDGAIDEGMSAATESDNGIHLTGAPGTSADDSVQASESQDEMLFRFKNWLYEQHNEIFLSHVITKDNTLQSAELDIAAIGSEPSVIRDYVNARRNESGQPEVMQKEFEMLATALCSVHPTSITTEFVYRIIYDDSNRFDGKRTVTSSAATRSILTLDGYRCIVDEMLTTGKLWLACFTTMSWNLMCHTTGTSAIKIASLRCVGDSLVVTSSKDNIGAKVRHVYANPHSPEICPILCLGAYLVTGIPHDENLFPGSGPSNRFSHAYREILKSDNLQQRLAELDVEANNIGVNSCRGGATTYVCGVKGACAPSLSAVSLRCGAVLNVPGVDLKNMSCEEHDDQRVGRIVAGLQPDSSNFFALPPHFDVKRMKEEGVEIAEVLQTCFPSIQDRNEELDKVLLMCLASVVHHAKWFRSLVHSSHILLSTAVFRSGKVEQLAKYLITGNQSPYMEASGIPNHLTDLLEIDKIVTTDLSNSNLITTTVASDLMPKLKEAGDDLTVAQLANMIQVSLRDSIKIAMPPAPAKPADLARTVADETTSEPDKDSSTTKMKAYHYDGKFYSVPNDYELPKKCDTLTGWQLWWEGSKEFSVPPFRQLGRGMLPKGLQKSFAEWKFLFTRMENHLKSAGVEIENLTNPTDEQIQTMYSECKEMLSSICSPAKRKQDCTLTVMTVAKRLRTMEKNSRVKQSPVVSAEGEDTEQVVDPSSIETEQEELGTTNEPELKRPKL